MLSYKELTLKELIRLLEGFRFCRQEVKGVFSCDYLMLPEEVLSEYGERIGRDTY